MSSDDLWGFYLDKNPAFKGDKDEVVRMTRSNFKKFFDETYKVAHDQGFKNGRAMESMEGKENCLFNNLFGGKNPWT